VAVAIRTLVMTYTFFWFRNLLAAAHDDCRKQSGMWHCIVLQSAYMYSVPLLKFQSHNRWANYPLNKHYVLAFMFSVYQLKMQILDYEYLDFINWINKMSFLS
jgi:hypothetical protein